MKTVTIIEDRPKLADAIKASLESSKMYSVVNTITELNGNTSAITKDPTDIYLIDILFKTFDLKRGERDLELGAALIAEIAPALKSSSIVMLTVMDSPDTAFQCLRDGAIGFLNKNDVCDSLPDSLDRVLRGAEPISPSVASRIRDFFGNLSPNVRTNHGLSSREHQVIELVSQGLTDQRVGVVLGIKQSTVWAHCREAITKLHAANRPHAVRKYVEASS